MMGIGQTELMILFVIALLLFGKNLPQVARSLGKGMTEFKKGLHGIEDEIHTASSRPASFPQSRPSPIEERDEAIAPKFEPPRLEPTEVTTEVPTEKPV